jgi:hypothetical protein
MTVVSAVPWLIVGATGGLSAMAETFGAPPLFAWVPGPFVSAYLVFESGLRIFQASIQGQPMGSLAGVLLFRLAHVFLPATGPAAPEKAAGQSFRSAASPPDPESEILDRFRIGEPLWALLPAGEQEKLRHRFGFEAVRWGRVTAATLFLVGAANALASTVSVAAGRADVSDVAWLAAGLFLCAEQVARWRALRNGRPRGSVLGWIVRPLARPLLSPRSN